MKLDENVRVNVCISLYVYHLINKKPQNEGIESAAIIVE